MRERERVGTDNRERGRLSGPLVDLLIRVTDSPRGEREEWSTEDHFLQRESWTKRKGEGGRKVCRH